MFLSLLLSLDLALQLREDFWHASSCRGLHACGFEFRFVGWLPVVLPVHPFPTLPCLPPSPILSCPILPALLQYPRREITFPLAASTILDNAYSLHCSSFFGLTNSILRILKGNIQKELLWSLWVSPSLFFQGPCSS